jgi:hypothetical protein
VTLFLPLWIQPSSGTNVYSGAQDRQLISAVSVVDGVKFKNDLLVSQRGAGANMSVDVAAGTCTVTGDSVANQGTYLAMSDATVNVPITAAPGSGTRTDLIVAQVYDNQHDGSGLMSWKPLYVQNGSLNTGAPPAVPASALALASVTVAAGTASITNALLTDLRLLNTMGDVPLWQLTGGNGQPLPSGGSGTLYTGWNFSDLIGMDTTGTAGEVKVRNPGRYVVHRSVRITNGGTTQTEKATFVEQVRGGSVIRRPASFSTIPHDVPSSGMALTVTGTARCNAGDILRAKDYQNSGTTLNLSDSLTELTFSGCWVGP